MMADITLKSIEEDRECFGEPYLTVDIENFIEELFIGREWSVINLNEYLIDVEFNLQVEIHSVWRLNKTMVVINDKFVYDTSVPLKAYRLCIPPNPFE